jgi:putative ABC transport system permease protein
LINRLVFENLRHRKLRTLLSALSIGFQVTMVLAIVNLSEGTLKDYADRARGIGADIFVKPPNVSFTSMSTATMSLKLVDYYEQQPHVAAAVGTLTVPIPGGFFNSVSGIDYARFTQLTGPFRFEAGGPFNGDHDLIIDSWYAEKNNLRVGATVPLLGLKWRICGIASAPKLPHLMVPLPSLQDANSAARDKVNSIFIRLDNPANTAAVIAALKAVQSNYTFASIEELVSLYSIDNAPMLKPFIRVVIGLSIIVGFLVVWLTMYTTVLERTREIGILKALGASPAGVLNILLREALLLAVGGWIAGILLSLGANSIVNKYFNSGLNSMIVIRWWPIAAAIAIFASLLGALYPGLKAARQDAIEALSYE